MPRLVPHRPERGGSGVGVDDVPWGSVHVVVAGVGALLLAHVGGIIARTLRQPRVIGEIAVGLAAGPLLIALAGPEALDRVLPAHVLDALKLLTEAGLVLFLVGVAHGIHPKEARFTRRSVAWVSTGSFVVPLCGGALLACGLLLDGDPSLRGHATWPALVIYMATALSITAVPVLARLLEDLGLARTTSGNLALTAAVIQDIAGWLLLSVAVSLNTGSAGGTARTMAVFAAGAVGAMLLRWVLRGKAVCRLFEGRPLLTALLLGALALTAGLGSERLGLTAVFGAVLVGAAVPRGALLPWNGAVARVTRIGRRLVPLFFVTTGVTVLTKAMGATSWTLVLLVTVLGFVCKTGGGYAGARIGSQSRWESLRIGVLMDTRGLTELIVLSVGHSTGILTGPMYLALLIMAVVTTAVTGPLLSAVSWGEARRAPTAERAPSSSPG
ncbi:cation:proton antiporter [Streptomyces sp. NPDC054796]